MPRSRNIKPGFFKNEHLANMEPNAQLLFIGLWTLADREGRLESRIDRIKAEIFPYMDHASTKLESWLTDLWDKQFIVCYEVGHNRYIQVHNWLRHQSPHGKEKDSEIPEPEDEIVFENQKDAHAWFKHGSCMNHTRFKDNQTCPPDSGYLIPDSGLSDTHAKPMQKKKKFDPLQIPIPDCINQQEWHDFVQHRKTIRSPLTELAAKRILNELEKINESGENPNRAISLSIQNGWKGVFSPKEKNDGKRKGDGFDRIFSDYAKSHGIT